MFFCESLSPEANATVKRKVRQILGEELPVSAFRDYREDEFACMLLRAKSNYVFSEFPEIEFREYFYLSERQVCVEVSRFLCCRAILILNFLQYYKPAVVFLQSKYFHRKQVQF